MTIVIVSHVMYLLTYSQLRKIIKDVTITKPGTENNQHLARVNSFHANKSMKFKASELFKG